ncbi:MAG: hypothetical protein PHE20_01655 [Patescibacteria group bacterium]|nr:hypothetical protein [Patescibacteria group bacterium]
MANKSERLRFLFEVLKARIENEPSEEAAHLVLEALSERVERIKDPLLASNFQSYWIDIADKIKDLSDEKYFADQKHLIELNIERIMFPDLAQN